MFDKYVFLTKVVEAGETLKSLAFAIGLHPNTLSRKINGESDFTYAEIQNICRALSLNTPEAEAIFFAKELAKTQVRSELIYKEKR